RSIVGHDNPDIAQSLDNIGSALLSLDRHEEALARHEEALALRLQTQGEDHPWLAYSLHGIGMSQLAAGDADAAIEALERALALRDETDAGDRGATEFALARALWLANREHARARELARSAHARMSDPRAGELSTAEQIAQWLTERGMQPSPLADSSRIAVDSSG